MSTAIKSQGTTLGQSADVSPYVFTTVANLTSITGPTRTANDIDVTDLSSTARVYLQGLEDEGEVSFEGYYLSSNTQHQNIRDNVGSGTILIFRVTMSDSATITFSARVNSFTIGPMAVDGATEFSCTLKVTGAVTHS